ncbi:epoxide hydrolase family protein [Aspergillus candidus]|uniref:Epoxide hydrolase n=1 Tax=Aspergillus candidus TaxID=41067 RepID=A0A2I2FCS6_ASPCN|nr:epoxide hydrolase [Aspergillus candidus]PLB38419.1 epoxide hydrolase [Aspergillus candidus]
MSLPFSKLPPTATISPTPFSVSVSDDKLVELHMLVRLSRIAPPTYENSQSDGRFGITSEWLSDTRDKWLNQFDWRTCETRANSFPQFTIPVEDINLHFAALFSEKPDAIPIILLHGWPGSFFEFLPLLQLFKDEFSPSTLPYHLIVPSLPGYAFSSGPPLDRDFSGEDVARIMDQLMKGLGFESGYVAQGGDIGAGVSRSLAVKYDSCKAVHVNFCPTQSPSEGASTENLTAFEKRGLDRMNAFRTTGIAYAMEHATRPSTIGHVLASSPIALLAWVGEKYLEWVDEPLSADTILEMVSLYWLTETFPRAIYPYRELFKPSASAAALQNEKYIHKPFGYSYFPNELIPTPKSWAAATGDLVFFREHQTGGHFAALERPADMKADLTDFVKQVWS